MLAEPIRVLFHLSQILENLEIPYLAGGSVASSIFGIPRATQDIDLVIKLEEKKLQDFIKTMQPEFYIDRDIVKEAIQRRSSFNAIHFETALKIDFFICGHDEHAVQEMLRRCKVAIDEAGQHTIFVASPEDIILQKLKWYRLGSRVSERQWHDVLGVIRVQGDRLDRNYLLYYANELAIADLLDEAFHDAE